MKKRAIVILAEFIFWPWFPGFAPLPNPRPADQSITPIDNWHPAPHKDYLRGEDAVIKRA